MHCIHSWLYFDYFYDKITMTCNFEQDPACNKQAPPMA